MEKLDKLIEEALGDEEARIIGEFDELGYLALSIGLFKGKHGWVTGLTMIIQVLMFVTGAWCVVHFFQATEVLPALKWGLSGAVLWIIGINLKLSLVPQMQADRVIRQIKRVELILARRQD